jgi:putative PIG3 family NAD(P)H quinone oxidoreductase
MRAVIITQPGDPGVLKIHEINQPIPGPGEVQVQVKCTALNRADLLQRRGLHPAPPGTIMNVPGLEMSGVVSSLGPGVTSFSVGQAVFGLLSGGGYSEFIVTHERLLMPMPDNLNFQEAASVPEVFLTAYDALFNQASLHIGESVLIHAAGSGVGVAATQLAKVSGAISFGTAGSAEKLSRAFSLGLNVGINYHIEDFAQIIATHTNSVGVDVILDMVGAPYWGRNLASLANKGRLVLIGSMGGSRTETNLGILASKRLRVYGTVLRARPLEEKISLTQQFNREVLPLLVRGMLTPVVDRVFPLEEVVQAHEYMESNQNFGKIVLTLE